MRAVCSRTTCFKCARVTAVPMGPYICGAHEGSSGPGSPSLPLNAPPSLPPPRPSPTANPSAASVAPPPTLAAVATPSSTQGSHSRNVNNCLVVITCQYPVVQSSVRSVSHTLTPQTPLAPQEECALLLPHKVRHRLLPQRLLHKIAMPCSYCFRFPMRRTLPRVWRERRRCTVRRNFCCVESLRLQGHMHAVWLVEVSGRHRLDCNFHCADNDFVCFKVVSSKKVRGVENEQLEISCNWYGA